MNPIFRRLLYFLRRSRYETDLRDEIETHRALRQAALERDGLEPNDAARASLGAMGNVALAVERPRCVGRARGRLAWMATTTMRSFLFGVAPLDPLVLGTVCIALAITAAMACYVPARRASRIDPVIALRHD